MLINLRLVGKIWINQTWELKPTACTVTAETTLMETVRGKYLLLPAALGPPSTAFWWQSLRGIQQVKEKWDLQNHSPSVTKQNTGLVKADP